jgi:hypothetical protein
MLKVDLTTHNGNPIGNLSVANIKTDKKGNILLIKTKKPILTKAIQELNERLNKAGL